MRIRRDFLNWRPDLDDFGHDGLTVADNVIHDEEGWGEVLLGTATSFTTANGLASHTLSATAALQAKPMGSKSDFTTTGINNYMIGAVGLATTTRLQESVLLVENPGGAMYTGTSFLTQGATSVALVAFDSCELNNIVFSCAFAVGESTTSAAKTISNGAATMAIVE